MDKAKGGNMQIVVHEGNKRPRNGIHLGCHWISRPVVCTLNETASGKKGGGGGEVEGVNLLFYFERVNTQNQIFLAVSFRQLEVECLWPSKCTP